MITALIIFVSVIIGIVAVCCIKNIKYTLYTIVFIGIIATLGICVVKPDMHKNFSLSVIDYLIKFNTDGSMTTTKQTTTTVIKEGTK